MDNRIDIGNGRTAVSFIPEDSTELAIVPLSVLKRLAKILPKANADQIIEDLRDELRIAQMANSLENALLVTQDFVNFHKTVNLIKKYEPEPESEEVEPKVANKVRPNFNA